MMAGSQESKAAYPSKATSHRRRQVDGVQDGGPRSQKEFRSVPGTRITENKYRLPSGSHAVHPRVCGEHSRPSKVIATCCGSSPRMRGTLNQILDWDDSERFIPAYAGNTAGSTGVSSPMTVHPRVCGEHARDPHFRPRQAGSSPRMRGTRRRRQVLCQFLRFIPAYAGNTRSTQYRDFRPTVHPRVCGEHESSQIDNSSNRGSSPRMRGTRLIASDALETARFIPAYAGNTAA